MDEGVAAYISMSCDLREQGGVCFLDEDGRGHSRLSEGRMHFRTVDGVEACNYDSMAAI